MPTDYPTALDDTTELPPASVTTGKLLDGSDSAGVAEHPDVHETIHGAVIALETKVGIDGSADTSSLDYKVAHITGLPFPPWTQGTNGDVTATTDDVTKTPLTIAAMAGQTADLWDVNDESGNPLVTLSPTGKLVQSPPTATGDLVYQLVTTELASDGIDIFQVYSTDSGRPLFNLDSSGGVEIILTSQDAEWLLRSSGPVYDPASIGDRGLEVNFPSKFEGALWITPFDNLQTAPLLHTLDGTGLDAFRVFPNGAVISNAHAAPADGDLNDSDFSLWLDDTPGSVFLHAKAKDSAGAVYTATIPMTPA